MICGTGLDLLQTSGEYPCAVCHTGVGNNSINCNEILNCNGCKLWVQWATTMTPNPYYRCARCMGNAHTIDGRPQSEVQVGPDKLEEAASFCYLGDMLFAGKGCEIQLLLVWKKPGRSSGSYYQFSHPTTSLTRPVDMYAYSSCMRSAMLQASETWPLTKRNLQRNDRAMIRQICCIKPEDVATIRSRELLAKLDHELEDLNREGFAGLGIWSVLVVHSKQYVIYRLMAGGGREAQSNKEETDGEGLPWVEANDSWPSRKEHLEIRCEIYAMRAASQLPGRGPTE